MPWAIKCNGKLQRGQTYDHKTNQYLVTDKLRGTWTRQSDAEFWCKWCSICDEAGNCHTNNYETVEVDKLGQEVPRKEEQMNTQVQKQATDVATPVTMSPEQLALMAKQLEENGEVLVQSEADVGTENLQTARNVEHTVH